MQRQYFSIIDQAGNVVRGASVTFTAYPGGAAVTAYSDNGVTVKAQPLTSDNLGSVDLYLPNGRYQQTVSRNGIDTLVQADIIFNDPADAPAPEVTLATLAAPSGSGLIGYIQQAVGAVLRTLRDWMDDRVSVMNFMSDAQKVDVKAGTRSLNVASAFAAALADGRPLRVPSGRGWAYLIGTTVSVPTGARIVGDSALLVLAAGVNNHVLRIANGADDVEISGLRIDGSKTSNAGGNGICVGGTGATNINVHDVWAFNCSANGIYFGGTTVSGIKCNNNYAYGNFAAGITGDETMTHFGFNDNHAWLNGTHGVGIIGVAKHGTIDGNTTWDNGQGDPNADNITGYNILNEDISVCGNNSSGGLNNGIHMGGKRITMSGNTVVGAAKYGIVLRSDTGAACQDCAVGINVSFGNGISGYWFDTCTNLAATGNVSRTNAAHGFAIDSCNYCTFTGNAARGNTLAGFKNQTASGNLTFAGCSASTNGTDGLDMTNMTESVVTGGTYVQNTGWGINRSGTDSNNLISANNVRANTAGQIAAPPISTRVSGNRTGLSRTVPSAATLTLPTDGEYFYITGTTNITNITASWPDRGVTLVFDDALTVVDGGNLRLSSNFVTTFMDTLTLISDGGNWYECSRSVN